jgi:uncharacterized damage-inducible protein DinB
MTRELDRFIDIWQREAAKTVQVLAALPKDQYDFRPDAEGRSLGELAWHLAEGDAYMTWSIANNSFSSAGKPPGMERPRAVEELAPGYERIHRDAVERVRKLTDEDLERSLTFFNGADLKVRDILWDFVLLHNIHHRGQLTLMTRLAGGQPAACFGPTREMTAARQAAAATT